MQDQLIEFDTAKLAKEKGFWIASYKCYDGTGFLNDTCNDEAVSFKYDYRALPSKDKYLAPTQSLLQKWLREVHNIHIEVKCRGKCYVSVWKVSTDCSKLRWSGFDTFEEALEEGLYQALKLIKL